MLLVCSASLHAAWNLVSKRAVPSRTYFMLSDGAAVLLLLPLLLAYSGAVVSFPRSLWILLAGTGICQAIYYSGLAAAYRRADLSVVYPLARSSSAIFTLAISLLLGRRDEIGTAVFAAVLLILAGSYFLPRHSFGRVPNFPRAGLAWALLAAAGTAGYSILDDSALRRLTETPMDLSYASLVIVYGTLEGISTISWLFLSLATKGGFGNILPLLRDRKTEIIFTGLATYSSYLLVLAAMPLSANVSYVVAFRQLSIPLSVGAGIFLLREPAPMPRLLGAAAMLAGVLLLGLS